MVAFQKKSKLDSKLAQFMGADEALRTEVTKKIWEHIKTHNLQNPVNKQEIIPDSTLSALIGELPIHMLKMSTELNKHFIKNK